MTTPFWCLLVVVFIPFVLGPLGGYYRGQFFDRVDNKNPRAQAAQLEGAGARAYAAQANAWEALAMFTAAVMIAHLSGVPAEEAAPVTIAFVVARLLHPIFYIIDQWQLRSASFFVGLICIITLFVKAA